MGFYSLNPFIILLCLVPRGLESIIFLGQATSNHSREPKEMVHKTQVFHLIFLNVYFWHLIWCTCITMLFCFNILNCTFSIFPFPLWAWKYFCLSGIRYLFDKGGMFIIYILLLWKKDFLYSINPFGNVCTIWWGCFFIIVFSNVYTILI